jgi:hypothetical protein
MGKRKAQRPTGGMVRYSTFLRPDQLAALRATQDRTGVTVAEQIRRVLDAAMGTKPAPRARA